MKIREREACRDSGSVTIVSTVVIAIAASMVLGFADRVRVTVNDVRAQSIADAVALAGVGTGRNGAERISHENGASLLEFDERPGAEGGSEVHVIVDFEGRISQAWASDTG